MRKKDKSRSEEEFNSLNTKGLLFKMIETHFLSEIWQIHQRRIKKMNLMILSFDHNTDDETSENENG